MRNKKGPLSFLVVLLFMGALLLFSNYSNREKDAVANLETQTPSSIMLAKTDTKDSDNDGLKDWEEVLWKTDPQNHDTDEDGTSDGEEIKNNRDPLVKAPDDVLTEKIFKKEEENTKPEALTATVGKQIITDLLMKKDKEEILLSAYSSLESIPKQENNYNATSIQKIERATQEEIKNYGNSFGTIIKKYFDSIEQSEVKIVEEFLKNGNLKDEEIKNLEKISLAYKNTALDASKIKVPSETANEHLNVLNFFDKISENIQNIRNSGADPILRMLEINNYQQNASEAKKSLVNINNYFLRKQIIFNKGESGDIFALYGT
ncbi:thrombospondin type 3 repeat-containing protein [Patescibacteria group bacterium]|nr:thrombospondin type 3 repeat-containing protein [Patescibacteria group bacterium]MBU2633351.1 thrombospondin type 3 repeat-containing protein [Patescibacteria group bacterium]